MLQKTPHLRVTVVVMYANKRLFWTALILILIGAAHSYYRYAVHHVPFLPGTYSEFWDVEAKVEFVARGTPVSVRLTLPRSQPGFLLGAEHTASSGYGLHISDQDSRMAEWTIREVDGPQVLYYRAQFQVDDAGDSVRVGQPPRIQPVIWSPALETAAHQLLTEAWRESADPFSLARALQQRLSSRNHQHVQLLLSEYSLAEVMVMLLNQADVPSRVLHGLSLEDGRRQQTLQPIVQVFSGDHWQLFDPATDLGQRETHPFLLWQQSAMPILEVVGGYDSRLTFSMLSTREPASSSVHALAISDAVLNLSIHSLPISEQAIFKIILLLPLGALVVVMLRVLIGLKTAGTFMPVLIAMAFLEMTLLTGILTFLLVVGAGLVLRQFLAYLNLLLVARVSAVIVCVIGLISLFSVLSFHLGISDGMKMSLFPMVILAWTIERMSILWEEEGPRDVMVQGFGSLLTAILAYFVMQFPWMRYWMFNFLGLQLVVLALIMMFGSYTGYRLLELWRFKPLMERSDARSD